MLSFCMLINAGACGDTLRCPLGALPGQLPCHTPPCNYGHFHTGANHHKTRANQVCKFISHSPPLFMDKLKLFQSICLGTSLVFRPQKTVAYQGKPAGVLCPASSSALVALQSGCLSICMLNLTIVKVIANRSLVPTLEANGSSRNIIYRLIE